MKVLSYSKPVSSNGVECIAVMADGVSSVLDYRIPYAWHAESGAIDVDGIGRVADFAIDRNVVVPGSVSTDGPVKVRLMAEAHFLAGEDAKGALIILEPETFPARAVLTAIIDRGAIGFVSDFSLRRFELPDAVPEIIGATENGNFRADCETRPFVGFAVSPFVGMKLRTLAHSANVFVTIECKAFREVKETEVYLTPINVSEAAPKPATEAGTWRKYAEGVVVKRLLEGYVRNQVKLPVGRKVSIPSGKLGEVFDYVTALADGNRNLSNLLAIAETKFGLNLDDRDVKRLVLAFGLLGDAGYFEYKDANEVTKADILKALFDLGVKDGDVLLVHSALSVFGHIAGGAKSIVDALEEAVGKNGTVLMPSFVRPECYLNGFNKRWDHRPSDLSDTDSPSIKWIGTLPMELMRLRKDFVRGKQLSHPWVGFGAKAAAMMSEQESDDSPFSVHSAIAQAIKLGGKVVLFGSDLTRLSFLHHFEDAFDLSCLGPGFMDVLNPDGSSRKTFIAKMTPGPREFYTAGEDARFFREAKAKGLQINKTKLGLGMLQMLDCRQLWEIGSELVRNDPQILIK